MIQKYINKDNLHHAYLIEGDKDIIIPELLSFLDEIKIKTANNPDLYNIQTDSFKMEDARILKSLTSEKGFSSDITNKKIFIISANSFLLEAQNSLLKVFEEPIENTHFFIVAPSVQIFIPTLLSRFYVIKSNSENNFDTKEAENFIKLPLIKRIDFLKELLASDDNEDEENQKDSPRARALSFLNALETVLHAKKASRTIPNTFEQIFKVRKYLRQPGSSTKSLMESVALGIPEKML